MSVASVATSTTDGWMRKPIADDQVVAVVDRRGQVRQVVVARLGDVNPSLDAELGLAARSKPAIENSLNPRSFETADVADDTDADCLLGLGLGVGRARWRRSVVTVIVVAAAAGRDNECDEQHQ